jgi:hypothetical protein
MGAPQTFNSPTFCNSYGAIQIAHNNVFHQRAYKMLIIFPV